MTKFEIEQEIRQKIKYKTEFKNMLYNIIRFKAVKSMEDVMKRYYITSENTMDNNGNSLIAMATIVSDHMMVEFLLKKGLNPNT